MLPSPSPIEPAARVRSRSPNTRAHGRPPGLIDNLGETIAALSALVIAAALWWAGAYFTLYCLRQVGIPLDALGTWQWAIPGGVSTIQLWWWPRRRLAEYKVAIFGGVTALDLGSTLYGMIIWGSGRALPLAAGITLPKTGSGLIVPAVIVSVLLTFIPERLALWALRELRLIWMDDHDDD